MKHHGDNENPASVGARRGLNQGTPSEVVKPQTADNDYPKLDSKTRRAARSAKGMKMVRGVVQQAVPEPFTLAKRAAIRNAELRRIADFRRLNGVVSEPVGWLQLGLRTVAERRTRARHCQQIPVSRYEAALVLAQINSTLPVMVIDKIVDQVNAGLAAVISARSFAEFKMANMDGLTAGPLVELNSLERDELKIRTIDATDETRKQRADRKSREKRARITEKRRQNGVIDRKSYLDNSASRAKPWESQNMSRAKWYRLGKPTEPIETSVVPTNIKNNVRTTLVSRTSIRRDHHPLVEALADRVINLPSMRTLIAEAAQSGRSLDGESRRIRHAVRNDLGAGLALALEGGAS